MVPRLVDWAAPAPSELAWRRSSGAQAEVEESNEGARAIELDAELNAVRAPEPCSQVLRVVTRQAYTFELTTGALLSLPLTDVVSSVGYRRCILQLRIHAIDSLPGKCGVSVGLLAAARDPRDPSQLLLGTTYLVSAGFDGSAVAPSLQVRGSVVSSLPDAFLVMMEVAPNDPGVIAFTIGVDLVLRK